MFLSPVWGFGVNNDLSDIHILYRIAGRQTTTLFGIRGAHCNCQQIDGENG